jgi:ribonuclease G
MQMKKEIIVSADELESRVAILEDGQLAELHVEREPRIVGSIYKARVVSVLPGMDAAFADVGLEKNVFLCADDVGYVSESGVTSSHAPRSLTISQRLKPSQEVVVQIVRAPVAAKGARATTRLALPGRYLVLLISDDRQVGVSRKIEDRAERDRLRKIGEQIRPKGSTLIMRTEAEGHDKKELAADLEVLQNLRDRIMAKAGQAKAPATLHQDLALIYQVIRDAFTEDVQSLLIDSKEVYDDAVELVQTIAPELRKRVKRYRGKLPVFYRHGIEGEIDRLLRRRVWLRAGGYISIDQAEAFTAIDVNTGRYTGTTGLAETILKTNLEAAEEVARQLRLRDLGGIIVIDFIDMERSRHRQRVMKAFQEALSHDRQKTKIVTLSPLGLIEMTRKRRGESLMGIITETCPQCAGLGRVRTPLTVALKIEREVKRLAAEGKPQAVLVRAVPRVIDILLGEGGQRSAQLDKAAGCPVYLRGDDRMTPEEHEILPMTAANAARAAHVPEKGDELTLDHVDPGEPTAGEPRRAWVDGFRVAVNGGARLEEGMPVIVYSAGHSFAIAYPKGMEPPASLPEQPAAAKRDGRRRGRRAKAAPEPEEAEVEVACELPDHPELEPSLVEEEATAAEAEEPAEEPAAEERERRRRGGRRRRSKRTAKPAAAAEAAPEVPAAVTEEPPAAEPEAEGAAEASRPTASERRRHGRRRRKPARGAQEKGKKREEEPAAGEAPAAPAEREPAPAPAVAAATPRRTGLLRRGARMIGKR